MREIKFKFWSKILKIFVIPQDSIFVGAFKDPEMIPLQYTGLKDKNGKEIYEGDIINWNDQNLEVVFSGGSFSIQPWKDEGYHCLAHCVNSDVEIIGNIYENPELLK